ncbi:MAG: hypothetical protein QG629_40 [Patescibacteria group bacterium]|nr:endonuclease/exonuclease/phosphatase family protein [Candidatus Saccharibacteria bacterium]MDQ5962958.1 hypothetical protein [Patescibacteria group bacterium]
MVKIEIKMQVRKLFTFTTVALLLVTMLAPLGTKAASDKLSVTVASYNLLVQSKAPLKNRPQKQAAFARAHDFDVIGAQEVSYRPQFQAVSANSAFGKEYNIFPSSYIGLAKSARPILYKKKFKLVSGKYIEYPSFVSKKQPAPMKTFAPVVLLQDKETGIKFYVVNTHNSAFSLSGRAKSRYDAGVKYRQGIEKLRKTGLPVFLTGDFNENASGGRSVYQARRANLNYCVLTEGDLMRFAGAAVHGQKGCNYRKENAIDRVYVTPDVKVNSYRLLPAGMARAGTDHRYVAMARAIVSNGDEATTSTNPNPVVKNPKTQAQCAASHRVWKNNSCSKKCKENYKISPTNENKCIKKDKNAVNKTKDTQKPTVSLASPSDKFIAKDVIEFAATAKDNVAVRRVEFYLNDRKVATDINAPYEKVWSVMDAVTRKQKLPNGSYSAYAIAYDKKGNKQKSSAVAVIINSVEVATDTSTGTTTTGTTQIPVTVPSPTSTSTSTSTASNTKSPTASSESSQHSSSNGSQAEQSQQSGQKKFGVLPNTGTSTTILLTTLGVAVLGYAAKRLLKRKKYTN